MNFERIKYLKYLLFIHTQHNKPIPNKNYTYFTDKRNTAKQYIGIFDPNNDTDPSKDTTHKDNISKEYNYSIFISYMSTLPCRNSDIKTDLSFGIVL